MSRVAIGLGSNIDEPLQQLAGALRQIHAHPEVSLATPSHVYLSAPIGPQDQPDFYNAAVLADTSMTPETLLQWLLDTELELGRQRRRHWGERCIDLDLLLFDDHEIQTEFLVIPHPRAHLRRFVLDPLTELLGEDHVLPGRGTLGSLQAKCADQAIRVLCEFPQ